jgi:hypothetical protein
MEIFLFEWVTVAYIPESAESGANSSRHGKNFLVAKRGRLARNVTGAETADGETPTGTGRQENAQARGVLAWAE